MRIISFIEEHKVIDKIINHLKLIFHAECPPPQQGAHHHLMIAAEQRAEYF
ncbi:MAG: acid--CoA ligase [Candidatus Aminicenantes bacterium]|nr:acid--CoA ligase [Candidatus Aminicenantes bacterium]